MLKVALIQLSVPAFAFALVTGYHVEPKTAAMSGKADPNPLTGGVSQVITCNFDSLSYVELFAGEYGQGGEYNLDVQTYPGGLPVASQDGGTYLRPQHWVRFDNVTVTHPERVVRGTQLEFKFTRTGDDSIQYYYQEDDPYEYGLLIDRSLYPVPVDWDLACRVYGRNRPIDSLFFGTHSRLFTALCWGWTNAYARAAKAEDIGAGLDRDGIDMYQLWRSAGPDTAPVACDTMSWAVMDTYVLHMIGENHAAVLPCLHRTAYFCTSADLRDTSNHHRSTWPELTHWAGRPPIGLYRPVFTAGDTVNPDNPFAVYLDSFFRRYGPSDKAGFYSDHDITDAAWRIRYAELWNEANSYLTRPTPGTSEHFQFPDSGRDTTYDRIFDFDSSGRALRTTENKRRLCSLYVRMCAVADSVRDKADSAIRLLSAGTSGVRGLPEDTARVPGDVWLQWFFEFGGDAFVDGIAVHPYQVAGDEDSRYTEAAMRNDLLFLDSLLGAHGARDKGLWATEYGFGSWDSGGTSERTQAASLVALLVSGAGAAAMPVKTYDRMVQYTLVDDDMTRAGSDGLTYVSLSEKNSCRLFRQARSTLVGSTLNGRLMDVGIDATGVWSRGHAG